MKQFIKNKILSLLYFIEVYFKIRVRNKTSPIDVYYENLSLECFKFFEKEMKSSSIFIKPKDIRRYAVSQGIKNLTNKEDLFLEFGVFRGESINPFANILKKNN